MSSLSPERIQEFLDELSFRECLGNFHLAAFDALVSRLATQTAFAANSGSKGLLKRFRLIGDNPFNDWRINQLQPESPVSDIDLSIAVIIYFVLLCSQPLNSLRSFLAGWDRCASAKPPDS